MRTEKAAFHPYLLTDVSFPLQQKVIQRAIEQSKFQATQQADLVHLEK